MLDPPLLLFLFPLLFLPLFLLFFFQLTALCNNLLQNRRRVTGSLPQHRIVHIHSRRLRVVPSESYQLFPDLFFVIPVLHQMHFLRRSSHQIGQCIGQLPPLDRRVRSVQLRKRLLDKHWPHFPPIRRLSKRREPLPTPLRHPDTEFVALRCLQHVRHSCHRLVSLLCELGRKLRC